MRDLYGRRDELGALRRGRDRVYSCGWYGVDELIDDGVEVRVVVPASDLFEVDAEPVGGLLCGGAAVEYPQHSPADRGLVGLTIQRAADAVVCLRVGLAVRGGRG